MFEIGFLELVLVGIVALLVLGPERLPHAARMTGAFLGRMSRMVQSLREEVEREVNVYEMQQRIKKQVEEGMIGDLKKELADAQKAIQQGFDATATSSKPTTPVPEPLETEGPEISPASLAFSPQKEKTMPSESMPSETASAGTSSTEAGLPEAKPASQKESS